MGLRVKISIVANKHVVDSLVSRLMKKYQVNYRINYVPVLNAMLEELLRVEINNAWFHGDYSRDFVADCSAYDVVLGTLQSKLMNLTGCSGEESFTVCTAMHDLLSEFALSMDSQLMQYIRNNHIDADTMVYNFMVEDLADGLGGGEYYLIEKPMGAYEILTEDNNWLIPANSVLAGNLSLNAIGGSSSRHW